MNELYIGLISGTSVDGIDAALVDFSMAKPQLLATYYNRFSPDLREAVLALYQPGMDEISRLGEADILLAKQFAAASNALLEKSQINRDKIHAIGSHGQTIRHYPHKKFTLQIGDPNIIAAETGITTIADFRRRDLAYGGQGAPLVPAFHQYIFASPDTDRVIVNIGGIANITVLSSNKNATVIGYDTGPGNALLDVMAEKYLKKSCDENGDWAAQGKVQPELLNQLLADPYFHLPHPKSTGREYFHFEWLQKYLSPDLNPVDIQATLVELTAKTIIDAIQKHFARCEVYICGGGVHNSLLMSRLRALAPNYTVESTQKFGVDPDWVEAMAFAWLAQQTLNKKAGNISSVTGAKQNAILGGIYWK